MAGKEKLENSKNNSKINKIQLILVPAFMSAITPFSIDMYLPALSNRRNS